MWSVGLATTVIKSLFVRWLLTLLRYTKLEAKGSKAFSVYHWHVLLRASHVQGEAGSAHL